MSLDIETAESQLHSSHYLKSVTELGDTRPIHATRDIYSNKGIKLFNAGAHVNSSVYERLMHHKLIPKLDECLATNDSVDSQVIVDNATFLIALDTSLQKMRAAMTDESMLIVILAKIPLNPCISFKLTVMRTQRQELFNRSIYIALVAVYIGIQSGLNEQQLVQLATAALLHDIGLLHVDPNLLELTHHMTEAERHHLYAHPLTAWMILREYREYSDEVTDAVLQHHERLDGSGYPQALSGDEIGQFGQIIAVAEIVASRYGKENPVQSIKLETILKLNARRYGHHIVGYCKVFYGEEAEISSSPEEDRQLIGQYLSAIAAALAGWDSMREKCSHGKLCEFINERMQSLKKEALGAGLNPYNMEEDMLGMENDPRACAEVRILLDEIIWQVRGVLHEIRRRWPKDNHTDSASLNLISDWILEVERQLS